MEKREKQKKNDNIFFSPGRFPQQKREREVFFSQELLPEILKIGNGQFGWDDLSLNLEKPIFPAFLARYARYCDASITTTRGLF